MTMLINDLSYCEISSAQPLISGGSAGLAAASALAFGPSSYTNTLTNARTRTFPNGGSISIARGFGIAIGNTPIAEVVVAGYGDIVVGSAHSTPNRPSQRVDIAFGIVIAIDRPN